MLLNELKGFPGGSVVKNLPANAGDTRDAGLIPGQEDPLEKEMTTYSSSLAWEIPWTEQPGGLQSMASQRVRYNWALLLLLPRLFSVYSNVSFPSCSLFPSSAGHPDRSELTVPICQPVLPPAQPLEPCRPRKDDDGTAFTLLSGTSGWRWF